MKLSERMREWDWINKGLNFSHVDKWADEVSQLEADIAGRDLMDAEASSFLSGQELVPEGTLDELERLRKLRNELASMYDENEPHEMGGPHISLLYVIDRMDDNFKEAVSHPTKE